MNHHETFEWTKREGCCKHCTLPLLGCDQGVTCTNHPVANAPEVMPLETSLFNGIDKEIQRRIIYKYRLDPNDPKKFSLSTPKRSSHEHHRVWKEAPSSERTFQDASNLTENVSSIIKQHGCVVPGLGNSGYRCVSTEKPNWRGKRIKSKEVGKDQWIDDDAAGCA